jgi:protein-S-isoprenylcysteine O-methyltransferase Ste14
MNALLPKAIVAFLALPGTVAFVIPLALLAPAGRSTFSNPVGFIPLGVGILGLLWCVVEFYRAGRGTLAPWAPPKALVVTGLYRYSRNPMYVAVLLILLGWSIGFRSGTLGSYAAMIAIAFHLRVILNEEPFLMRTHGQAWRHYASTVPRWLGARRSGEE